MTTTTSQILLICGDHEALATGAATYRGTKTGPMGSPNIALYDVQVGGYDLDGRWDNDARHPICVHLPANHPLSEAVRLLAAHQTATWELRQMQTKPPAGFTPAEWDDMRRDTRGWMARTRDAVDACPSAAQLAS